MGFKNEVSEKEVVDLNTQKERLLSDISALGVKMDEALKTEQEINGRIEKLNTQEAEFEGIFQKKFNEVEELIGKRNLIAQEIDSLKKDLEDLGPAQARRNELQDEILRLVGELDTADDALTAKKLEFDNFVSESEKTKASIQAEIDQLKAKLTELSSLVYSSESQYKKAQDDLSSLLYTIDKATEKSDALASSNSASEDKLKATQEETSKEEARLKELKETILKDASEWELAKVSREEDLKKREEEVVRREGDVSLKESWVLEKEKTLKDLKEQLEKFYNRKFTNVIL